MNLEEQRNEDLRRAKEIIDMGIIPYTFQEYAAFYSFSNEQINQIYSQIDFTNYHTALTVLSSGDHAFNAIYKGIDNVDTFDVNRLTEYYALGFKKRAIECLTFAQFCSLYTSSNSAEIKDLEDEVIKNMDEVYKKFWQNYKYELKCYAEHFPSILMWAKEYRSPEGGVYNIYLDSEETYKYLQKRLEVAKITFTQANITELPIKFGEYDFIELSNILCYKKQIFSNNVKLHSKKLIIDVFKKNLNSNGLMLYQTGSGNLLKSPFMSKQLKRAQRFYKDSDDYACVFGLQKGGRK